MPSTKNLANRRTRIAGEQDHLCYYCGRKMSMDMTKSGSPLKATLEHLTRRTDGGSFHHTNIVVACQRCNCNRGDYSVDMWKAIHQEVINIRLAAKAARKVPGKLARKSVMNIEQPLRTTLINMASKHASKYIIPQIREKYWQMEKDVVESYLQTVKLEELMQLRYYG